MTPELNYYWEGAREWCEDSKYWDEEKKTMLQRYVISTHSTPILSWDFYVCMSILLLLLADYLLLVRLYYILKEDCGRVVVPGRCEGRDAGVSASLGDSTGSPL